MSTRKNRRYGETASTEFPRMFPHKMRVVGRVKLATLPRVICDVCSLCPYFQRTNDPYSAIPELMKAHSQKRLSRVQQDNNETTRRNATSIIAMDHCRGAILHRSRSGVVCWKKNDCPADQVILWETRWDTTIPAIGSCRTEQPLGRQPKSPLRA